MTERAGAALSHVLIRAGRMTFFGSSGAAKFSAPTGSGCRFAEIAGGNSFRRRMHGCMSHTQGTPAWPGSSHRPHYLAKSRLLGRRLLAQVFPSNKRLIIYLSVVLKKY
jgi:hypothetical protein